MLVEAQTRRRGENHPVRLDQVEGPEGDAFRHAAPWRKSRIRSKQSRHR